jgi:hypothetical protein
MTSLTEERGAFGVSLLLCENPLPPIDEAIAAAGRGAAATFTEAYSGAAQLLSEQ